MEVRSDVRWRASSMRSWWGVRYPLGLNDARDTNLLSADVEFWVELLRALAAAGGSPGAKGKRECNDER